jgi:hypothetical protein
MNTTASPGHGKRIQKSVNKLTFVGQKNIRFENLILISKTFVSKLPKKFLF